MNDGIPEYSKPSSLVSQVKDPRAIIITVKQLLEQFAGAYSSEDHATAIREFQKKDAEMNSKGNDHTQIPYCPIMMRLELPALKDVATNMLEVYAPAFNRVLQSVGPPIIRMALTNVKNEDTGEQEAVLEAAIVFDRSQETLATHQEVVNTLREAAQKLNLGLGIAVSQETSASIN